MPSRETPYTVTFGSQPPGAACCGTSPANVNTSVNVGSVTINVLSAPSISAAFSPAVIQTGGTSTLTYSLGNSSGANYTNGAFTDTLTGMSTVAGAVGGTCTGTAPANLAAGTTSLSFTGITIPNGGCTVTVGVTSNTAGAATDAASGVTTTQIPAAGPGATAATLTVDAAPTISEAFSPASIASGGSSTLTYTISNTNANALTGGAFTDTLSKMSAVGGAVGGSCLGTTPNTLIAGVTALSFTGIALPASSSCTVSLSVTSSISGSNTDAASGVATTQTPAAGQGATAATLTVQADASPTISEGFNPTTIATGGSSSLTLTLANSNLVALTGAAFSDSLVNMSALGGSVGGTCVGTTPSTLLAGATALNFSGITIPASGNCTVVFSVTSNTAGAQNNAASGVTTTQTPVAGVAATAATLTVLALPTISKAFSPTFIQSGGTSTVTLTIANATNSALSGGAFTDTLANMSAAGGAVGGTCTGTTPNTLSAGATSLSFTGINIPANGNCTVSFSVTSSTVGVQPNATSGVTTTQTTLGSASNTANLTVLTAPMVSKAFAPGTIQSAGSSVVTVTIANSNTTALTGGAFTDTLTGMSALGGAVAGTCTGTAPNSLTAGATSLSFTGINLPASGSCTVTFSVTSTTIGSQTNTTSGVTTTQTPTAGAASNTAGLTVNYAIPTISKAFSPTTIQSGGSSTVTLTLSNANTVNLTGGAFSDTLTNMSAAAGAVGGTCTGTSPSSLSGGATSLSFTGITIPASGSCTVTFGVTSSTPGAQANAASGITTNQTAIGTGSNTATLTVLSSPTISKAFGPATIQSGGTSTVTLTLTNGTAVALGGGAFTDTLVNMTAAGGAVAGTCAGTTPASLTAGAISLSFTAITIPASGSCTVTFSVTSTAIGTNANATSGVTTTLTPTAGAASNSATLMVTYINPTITKAFAPTSIQSGGTSVVTLTLANTNTVGLTGGAFTDTLANMSATAGNVTGTCVGTSPSSLSAGATALSFTGINIPPSGNCTVIFSVTSSTAGVQPNATSGITTNQTAVGTASNSVNLTVYAPPTISKAFAPATIQTGANSVVTITLTNSNTTALTAGAFTDTLANMTAVAGAVGGTCAGTAPNALAAGATALSFTGITIPASASCTVTFSVTSTVIGAQPNATSGVTTTQTPTAGAASNTATLTVTLIPATISKAFSPVGVPVGGNSSVTLTLGNANTTALTAAAFTDTLVNMSALGGGVTGTCVGTTPATLTAGATALSFTGITIPATSNCTVTFKVTSSHSGLNPNTTSAVTTTQAPTGAASNTANLTVAPPLSINATPASLPAGTVNVSYSVTTLTATGGTPPYTWTATGLPPGLTIGNSTGTIAGTPTSLSGSPYNVTVTVTDANGTTATASYSITVGALPLKIITGTLPTGVINVPYPFTSIQATGGVGAYTWTITGLPQGLSTDGNGDIIGTPTNATGSPFSVKVTVTDAANNSISRTYTLTISTTLTIVGPAALCRQPRSTPRIPVLR